ncbi:T9SS type A sorting domain-containing protein [uncultured Winogradskyella sp.]|uniref:T9SS type A sorting domain-containing protein n=1 Tax=uncultured Winogradskyella sp. TaxID=395353 RepID=UPI00263364C9|nr:T9SS type A sorting domain-containing protein [uncultured Winogradskyella sp.]
MILIASSDPEDDSLFNHGLSLSLVDNSNGMATGEDNGTVTTNNADLNQIFSDYNVSYYELVNEGTSYERFELFCNCDAELLKQELDALSSVVSSTELMFLVVLLSLDEQSKAKVKIYPNPYKHKVTIDFDKPIIALEIYDITGKSVYESQSISNFENFSQTLESGVYLLKIKTESEESITKKLVKS